jgi:hypothetical protein
MKTVKLFGLTLNPFIIVITAIIIFIFYNYKKVNKKKLSKLSERDGK